MLDSLDTITALEVLDPEIGQILRLTLEESRALGASLGNTRPDDPTIVADLRDLFDIASEYLKAFKVKAPEAKLETARNSLNGLANTLRRRIAEEVERRFNRLDVLAERIGRRIGDETPKKIITLTPVKRELTKVNCDDSEMPATPILTEALFGRVSGRMEIGVVKLNQNRHSYMSRDFIVLKDGEAAHLNAGQCAVIVTEGFAVNAGRDRIPENANSIIWLRAKDKLTVHGPVAIRVQDNDDLEEIEEAARTAKTEADRRTEIIDNGFKSPIVVAGFVFGMLLPIYFLLAIAELVQFNFTITLIIVGFVSLSVGRQMVRFFINENLNPKNNDVIREKIKNLRIPGYVASTAIEKHTITSLNVKPPMVRE